MKQAWIFFALLAALPLAAQPVFTEADLPEIGYQAELISDTSEVIIVDVGTTGGPQTWDYSRDVDGVAETLEILDPDGTDWGSSFPTAQYAYHMVGTLQDTINGDIWQYMQATSTEFKCLGDVYVSDTFLLFHDYDPDRLQSPFPLQMGTKWTDSYYTYDSLDETGMIAIEQQGSSSSEIDAWGTISVPHSSYRALRILSYDTAYTTIYFFGFPQGSDTSVTIGYRWVAKDVGPVMMITSQNWEQDPGFDTAGSYVALSENNHGPAVAEQPAPSVYVLIEGSQVVFQLKEGEPLNVSLYDALGRRVADLYQGISSGAERVNLPVSLASGVYFVKVKTTSLEVTRKFVSIR